MEKFNPVAFNDVEIKDGFWKKRMKINETVTIYSVRDRFRDTGRFEAFKFNWREGSDIPKPHIFWDSDVAKWMESVAFILSKKDVPELRADVQELISLMEKNQQEDGYFNISHTVVQPENRFKLRDDHELYCLGHFIEAAIAWKKATDCDRLINIVDKYIDLVIKVFCQEKTAEFVTPGHEEIELALIKLYRETGNKKYLELAMFFINERGLHPEEIRSDWYNSSYNQSHLPVRKQNEAMGHCVRACYLYSALADAAKETGDRELFNACKSLFLDIINKKMYISGGIGSSHNGEAFTSAYDLPSDTAYAETCAAISLMMFADRMKDIELDSVYADTVEREMYNGIISGISLDGKAFFYENPLEISLCDRFRHTSMLKTDERLPVTQRQEIFSCSCCPPNLTRFFASIGEHAYSYSENSIIVHQYLPSCAKIGDSLISAETKYPENGKVKITVHAAKGKRLFLRIPFWCKDFSASASYETVKGYARFDIVTDSFELSIDMNMKVKFYCANPYIRATTGKIAVMYGPVLYCAEGIDNEKPLFTIRPDTDASCDITYDDYFGVNTLKLKAYSTNPTQSLYVTPEKITETECELKLIPYFAFANRGESDMTVWMRS